MKTTLDKLLAFSTVVASGSISAAAQQLAQTTSGVSRALSRLEEKLDVTLLQRTTRRLEPTEEGHAFLAQAWRILESVEEAEEQMRVRRQTISRAAAHQCRRAVHVACRGTPYRNTALTSRITCFLDYLSAELGSRNQAFFAMP